MNNFENTLNGYSNLVEKELYRTLSIENELVDITNAMTYSLSAGGKRIRPALTLEFCRAVCGDSQPAVPAAVAVEMIHTYSLIHDDLPSMDNDDMRRGKPSCHKKFGEASALLAGDALLTEAFYVLSDMKNNSLSANIKLNQILLLSEAASYRGMIGGQVIDLAFENKDCDQIVLNTMHKLKTGALIEASAVLGVLAGNGDFKLQQIARNYASKIGLAFQITDDILDVCGDQQLLGKATGRDLKQNKTTYVTLFGVDEARKIAENLISEAKAQLEKLPFDNGFLSELADFIINREK